MAFCLRNYSSFLILLVAGLVDVVTSFVGWGLGLGEVFGGLAGSFLYVAYFTVLFVVIYLSKLSWRGKTWLTRSLAIMLFIDPISNILHICFAVV